MPDEGISQLPSGSAAATDEVPVVKAGATTRVPAQSIADLRALPTVFPITSVTLLQAALDGKALLVHTHAIESVTLLQTALDSKALLVHTHAIASVTLLQATLDGKAALVHTHPIESVTLLQTTLDGKAALVHTHAVGSVTFVADVRLLGRAAGSAGAGQEITVGAGLSLAAGALTATGGGGGAQDSETIVRLAANTNTTVATEAGVSVPELSFAMAASADYFLECHLIYQTAAVTTGIGLGLNGPASPVAVGYNWWTYTAVGTPLHRYGSRFGTTAPPTTGVGFVNSNVWATLTALIRNGVNPGSATLIFRSEVNGSAVTIQAGSLIRYRKLT